MTFQIEQIISLECKFQDPIIFNFRLKFGFKWKNIKWIPS